MENLLEMTPNWAERLFPTHPSLANILGDTDFDSQNSYILDVCGIPHLWISRFWLRIIFKPLLTPNKSYQNRTMPKKNSWSRTGIISCGQDNGILACPSSFSTTHLCLGSFHMSALLLTQPTQIVCKRIWLNSSHWPTKENWQTNM